MSGTQHNDKNFNNYHKTNKKINFSYVKEVAYIYRNKGSKKQKMALHLNETFSLLIPIYKQEVQSHWRYLLKEETPIYLTSADRNMLNLF